MARWTSRSCWTTPTRDRTRCGGSLPHRRPGRSPSGPTGWSTPAASLVSEAAGLHLIPPTVLRDGPFGPGMVQLWVDTKDGDDLVDVLAPRDVPAGWRSVLRARDRFGDPAVLTHADHPGVALLAA